MNIKIDDHFIVVEMDEEYTAFDQVQLAETQRSLFDAIEAASNPRIIVDLSKTRYFGSEFLEVLFRVWHRVNKKQGKFALAGIHPPALETLQITHLDSLWPIHATVDAAMAAMR